MEQWILMGAKTLFRQPQTKSSVGYGQVKVKVSHVMLSNFDSLVYSGEIHASYPVVIGRFAIGIVAEVGEGCFGFTRGMRVYIKSAKACNACLACKSGHKDDCEHVRFAGRDYDGFLRDFVVVDQSELEMLPNNINDSTALCIDAVALAETIYEKLHLPTGKKVAVIGGNALGNLVAQTLLFHKLVPVLVDNNQANREKAQSIGVPYVFAADDDFDEHMAEATLGKGCDAAVYVVSSRLSASMAVRACADNATVIVSGFSSGKFSFDAKDVIEKGLHVWGVPSGYGMSDVAINMLVQKRVTCDIFEQTILTSFDDATVQSLLEEGSYAKTTVLKLTM